MNAEAVERAMHALASAQVALRDLIDSEIESTTTDDTDAERADTAIAGVTTAVRKEPLTPAEAGSRLRRARLLAGHATLAEAQKRSGIKASQISRYERGDVVPGWIALHQLAVTLALDPRILFPEMMGVEPSESSEPDLSGRRGRKYKGTG